MTNPFPSWSEVSNSIRNPQTTGSRNSSQLDREDLLLALKPLYDMNLKLWSLVGPGSTDTVNPASVAPNASFWDLSVVGGVETDITHMNSTYTANPQTAWTSGQYIRVNQVLEFKWNGTTWVQVA